MIISEDWAFTLSGSLCNSIPPVSIDSQQVAQSLTTGIPSAGTLNLTQPRIGIYRQASSIR